MSIRSTPAISYRRRLVALTALFATAVVVLLVVVFQVALTRSSNGAIVAVLDNRADAVVTSAEANTTGSLLVVPEAHLDPGVAVYDAHARLVAGVVPPSQARYFAELATTTTPRRIRLGHAFELLGRPFSTDSGAHGVVVISERLDTYQDLIHDALEVSIGAGLVIVLLATWLTAWASRRALAPVVQMAETAEAWSHQDLERRFDLGPPTNEIRALGHTLDGLLDRVRRTILDEQRLTSELAHELRTPLAGVLAVVEVISDRDDLDDELRQDLRDIDETCRAMAATVTSLLDLARSQASGARRAHARLAAVLAGLVRSIDVADRVHVRVSPGTAVAVSESLTARVIAPVLENGLKWAETVTVTSRTDGPWVEVHVTDDGPGIDPQRAESIFVPGQANAGGTGLGLALARRVARSVGGDVTLDQGRQQPGAAFVIRLPAAEPSAQSRS